MYRHPRRSKNMSIHPIVVTYDEGVANFKLRPLNRICTCIIKYQIYAILNFYYIVNYVYYVISRALTFQRSVRWQ